MPSSGNLAAIKLVHLYGFISCYEKGGHWSYWGCRNNRHVGKGMTNVVITNSNNDPLLPPDNFLVSGPLRKGSWYDFPGYNSWSPELVLSVLSHPLTVSSGQELRLWYGEDLKGFHEGDNGGRVCCDVYALYV